MIQDDIWKKRQRLEECEDNYRRSCKKIENQYEEANYSHPTLVSKSRWHIEIDKGNSNKKR